MSKKSDDEGSRIVRKPQAELLRERYEQHKPKNQKSKVDDKRIYDAMTAVQLYFERKYGGIPIGISSDEGIGLPMEIASAKHPISLEANKEVGEVCLNERTTIKTRGGIEQYKNQKYYIEFSKSIEIDFIIKNIQNAGLRTEFEHGYSDRRLIPDGGVLFLRKQDDPEYKKILLISEMKRQGTNDKRLQEGKKKQATGNAIERLGKNLTGVKAMMNHEAITPFVVFGWGVDFVEKTVLTKLVTMNEFYKLNQTYVHKRDGDSNRNKFSPTSFYFKEEQWNTEEMFDIMVTIVDASISYYIY